MKPSGFVTGYARGMTDLVSLVLVAALWTGTLWTLRQAVTREEPHRRPYKG